MQITELGKMAEGLMDGGEDPNTGVALMVADVALQVARAYLVATGNPHDVTLAAVINQIDVALERK